MAVVAVHAPGLEEPLREAVLSGTPHVVQDLVVAVVEDRLPDARRDVVERLVPGHALPFPGAALAGPAQGVENALGVVELVDRGGALGAVAAPRAGVRGIAGHLGDGQVLLLDVGEEPAGRLAVEAGGRDEHELPRHLARVGAGVVLDMVVPRLWRRVVPQPLVVAHPGKVDRHRALLGRRKS
nr:hypothetical protein [Actinomadura madurae]